MVSKGKALTYLLQLIIKKKKQTYHTIILFVGLSKLLHKHCLKFPLGVKMAPKQTENNAYENLEWPTKSIMECYGFFSSGQFSPA